MRKFQTQFLATAAFVAFAGAAHAADMGMPTKAPAYAPPPALSWTGFYLGGNLGAGFGDKWWTCRQGAIDCEGGAAMGTTSMDGFMGGVQGGYNWQTGSWVLGIEGTFDWTNMHGKFPFIFTEFNASSKLSWIATVVGRVGITIDRALVYAGGGLAWTHEKDDLQFNGAPFSWSGSNTPVGATFLAGVEYAIDPHWSARIQYNFYDFGNKDVNLTPNVAGLTPNPEPISTELRIHSITAGVNYRF